MDDSLDFSQSSSFPVDGTPVAPSTPLSPTQQTSTPVARVAATKLSEGLPTVAPPVSSKAISAPISSKDALDQFKSKLTHFLKEKYPNLSLDDKELDCKFLELQSMNCSFENYMEQLESNSEIHATLASINEHMPQDPGEASFLKNLVTDLLVSTYLIPARESVKSKSALYRNAIQIFTPNSLLPLLKTLSYKVETKAPIKFSEIHQLAHFESQGITIDTYATLSHGKKMLLFSLANIVPRARGEILSDPLFKKIQNSRHLIDWMLASSGSLEQTYITTCYAAAFGQDVISKIPTVVGLLLVGKYLGDGITTCLECRGRARMRIYESQIAFPVWWKKDPTKREYVTQRLTKIQGELEQIRQKAEKILQEEGEGTPAKEMQKRRRELTEQWNQNFQRLAAIANPDGDIVVLTKKPIKDQWALSAVLMFFVSLFSFLVPGTATFGSRLRGVDLPAMHKDLEKVGGKLDITPLSKESVFAKKEALWEQLFSEGGAIFTGATHSNYLKAVVRGGKKVFLLGDPKESCYQILSFEKMDALIKKMYPDAPAKRL